MYRNTSFFRLDTTKSGTASKVHKGTSISLERLDFPDQQTLAVCGIGHYFMEACEVVVAQPYPAEVKFSNRRLAAEAVLRYINGGHDETQTRQLLQEQTAYELEVVEGIRALTRPKGFPD